MADTPVKVIYDIQSKTEQVIELTPEEIQEMQAAAEASKLRMQARELERQAVLEAKEAAKAKLEALGLTPEEIAAITGA